MPIYNPSSQGPSDAQTIYNPDFSSLGPVMSKETIYNPKFPSSGPALVLLHVYEQSIISVLPKGLDFK